jgi:signal transduction histidine kinase
MFSGVLAHRLARPLWELARAVKDFGSGKLDRRAQLPHRSSWEARELASAFNDMAGRIQALVREQRELLGVVSHELRTPLARLRVLLAILQDREGDSPLVAKFEREIVEMDALVGELLAEARISAQALTLTTLDLHDLTVECAERLGIKLQQTPDAIEVQADATLVSRAITLLLDNAIKHGGTQVRVYATEEDRVVRYRVEDNGPGIEAEDLPKLFNAFARGRGAAADERHGVGLGLYLVRRIAEAHGGEAFASNLPGGGACIGLTLPRGPIANPS